MRLKAPMACLVVALLAARTLAAQSLAGLAEQEEERRKAVQAPARVITDKDLHPTTGPAPDAKAASAAPAASHDGGTAAAKDAVAVAAAQYRAGALPEIPTVAISGGDVLLELSVSREGRVEAINVLRHTAPFTDALGEAVRTWQFRPAEDADVPKPGAEIDLRTRKPVASRVLVAALFRPPALYSTTLGEPPMDVAAPSEAVPVPLAPIAMPLYPPLAVGQGVVLTELRVGANGRLIDARVIRSAPPFDGPTLDVVRRLLFRPARVHGRAVPGFVYVVTGFRSPIVQPTGPPAKPGGGTATP
jgi:outer membrane biosynthesis protein TonB